MPEHHRHPHKGSVRCAPKNLQIEITYLIKSFNKAVTCVFTCVYTNTNAALQRAIYATICNAIVYTQTMYI